MTPRTMLTVSYIDEAWEVARVSFDNGDVTRRILGRFSSRCLALSYAKNVAQVGERVVVQKLTDCRLFS